MTATLRAPRAVHRARTLVQSKVGNARSGPWRFFPDKPRGGMQSPRCAGWTGSFRRFDAGNRPPWVLQFFSSCGAHTHLSLIPYLQPCAPLLGVSEVHHVRVLSARPLPFLRRKFPACTGVIDAPPLGVRAPRTPMEAGTFIHPLFSSSIHFSPAGSDVLSF